MWNWEQIGQTLWAVDNNKVALREIDRLETAYLKTTHYCQPTFQLNPNNYKSLFAFKRPNKNPKKYGNFPSTNIRSSYGFRILDSKWLGDPRIQVNVRQKIASS